MRTYLALPAKSRQFMASEAIRAAREAARVDELAERRSLLGAGT